MKSIRTTYLALAATLAVLAATVILAPAREISFVWNQPNDDADGWTLQTKAPGGEWVDSPDVTNPEVKAQCPDTQFEVRVFAWKKIAGGPDAGKIYSPPSDSLTVPSQPSKPDGVRVTINITIDIPKP